MFFLRSWRAYSQKMPNFNSFCQRTHNCGELRLSNEGEKVELFGWLSYKRLNKFLVLRDCYGKIQVTIPDSRENDFVSLIKNLHYESALRIQGKVVDRGRNRNKQMPTGDVEVVIEELEILNAAPAVSPLFNESKNNESLEHTRLTYRYLDIRSSRMQHNLRFRSYLQHSMRKCLVEMYNFVDVETPTLSQWTPGGATEFVVPASKPNLKQFYTLPQSPQIYKQLLMCGGIDRYFQIARCYRNEGAKSDRQPEFTQVDLEMSFVTQDQIISLVEALITESWPTELLEHKPVTPFKKMTYKDAMKIYSSDKPDMRKKTSSTKANLFEFLWVVDFPLFAPKNRNHNFDGMFESVHHPFTAPLPKHLADLKAGRCLENITAQHYDLVLNGVELGGGSIRIHDASLQRHVLENILKLPTATLEFFLNALSFGAPPHGGFALGFDRYVALLADESFRLLNTGKKAKRGKGSTNPTNLNTENAFVSSIRDVIAFPKTKNARCLTMGAPSALPTRVYEEYSIKIADEKLTDETL